MSWLQGNLLGQVLFVALLSLLVSSHCLIEENFQVRLLQMEKAALLFVLTFVLAIVLHVCWLSTHQPEEAELNPPPPPSPSSTVKVPFVHKQYRTIHRKHKHCLRYPQTVQVQHKSFGSCSFFEPCNDQDRNDVNQFVETLNLSHIRYYLQFWGQARTGHSWIGAALDAAPDALVANELDVWKHFDDLRQRNVLYQEIAYNSFECGMYGRFQVYDYTIANFSQGLVGEGFNVTVMGDKKGDHTALEFVALGQPWHNETSAQLQRERYQELQDFLGEYVTIKNVAVLRNPFDMIATQFLRSNPLENETVVPTALVNEALDLERQIYWARTNLGTDWFVFRMEVFATDTANEFRNICAWLEITCADALVEMVVNRTHHVVHESRLEVEWSKQDKNVINEFIHEFMANEYDEWK